MLASFWQPLSIYCQVVKSIIAIDANKYLIEVKSRPQQSLAPSVHIHAHVSAVGNKYGNRPFHSANFGVCNGGRTPKKGRDLHMPIVGNDLVAP